nr:reverse transcriptase domain, reverse transcriptase zinc-binding domain protein [Tanacetum cinerariifolium]
MTSVLLTVSLTGGSSVKNSTSLDTMSPLITLKSDDTCGFSVSSYSRLMKDTGQLNHLSGDDKVHLFNALNLWIRNIVIRKRVEDLQLGIESYQTKLNLTQPDWDAYDFLFKEDYTIVSKPRAVIYRDMNDQNKMMREIEMHKFSDDTLNRILENLDHMVKDFKMEIKDFYGKYGGLFSSAASHGSSGVWVNILKAIAKIENFVPSFRNSFVRKIANGSSISFWKDVWCNLGTRVMNSFPRLYGIETNKECNLSDRWRLCNGVWEWGIPIRGRVADDLSRLVELIGTCGMAIDYCIMKEGMSILRGRKSVPGLSSSKRENEKKGTTLSSRELHDKEFV